MLKLGIVELLMRGVVFITGLVTYFSRAGLERIWTGASFNTPVGGVHFVWFFMMLGMVGQLTRESKTERLHKGISANRFLQVQRNYNTRALEMEVRKMDIRAARTFLFWAAISGVVALCYMNGIISGNEVLLVVVTFYFCDALCMLVWCPLQKLFMKSQCCVNCRIYGWGSFFVFGLLLLVPGQFSYSLFAMSLLVLTKWESAYVLHPERFWAGSNTSLKCSNCTQKGCTLKRKLHSAARHTLSKLEKLSG